MREKRETRFLGYFLVINTSQKTKDFRHVSFFGGTAPRRDAYLQNEKRERDYFVVVFAVFLQHAIFQTFLLLSAGPFEQVLRPH